MYRNNIKALTCQGKNREKSPFCNMEKKIPLV